MEKEKSKSISKKLWTICIVLTIIYAFVIALPLLGFIYALPDVINDTDLNMFVILITSIIPIIFIIPFCLLVVAKKHPTKFCIYSIIIIEIIIMMAVAFFSSILNMV